MRKVLHLLIFVLAIWVGNLQAQVNFSVPTLETCGDTVSVPIIVTDFSNITAFSFSMHWDETVLEFDSVGAFNLQHLNLPDFGTTQSAMGFYTAAWVDDDGSGETAANGTIIYRAYFTVLGGMGASSDIEFTGVPTPIVVGSGFPPMSIPVTTTDGVVNVDDTIDPVIACPANVVVNTMDPTAVVNGIAPTSFSDNCGVPDVTYSTTGATTLSGDDDISGETFNAGVTTVTYTAADLKGNTDDCSFTVTINQVASDLLVTAISDTAFCDDTVLAIDIEVNNFSTITALSFSLTWDETIIQYDSIKNFNLQHLDMGDFGLAQTGNGILTFAWIDDDGSGETVPNGDSIFTIYFTTLTSTTDESDIEFSNIPTSIVAGQGFPPSSITILTQNGVGAKVDNPPVINNCPTDISVNTDMGVCGAIISWTLPVVTDDCDMPVPSLNQIEGLVVGSLFPVGMDTIVYTATDSKMQSDTCSFTVTVADVENPVAVCPTIADVVLDGSGNGTLPANIGDGSSTDNCSLTETSPTASFTCADLGAQTVILTATDASGNTDTETCSFNVVDNEAPVAVCPTIADIVLDGSGNATLPANIGDGSSTDNCSLTETSPSASFTCADIGVQTVVLTATDGSGNSDTETCSFNVVDNEVPVAVCPTIADIVLDGSGNASLPANIGDGSSTDNCSLTETSPSASFTCADIGAQTVVLTATDGSGNSDTETCSFNVVDNEAPVAACPTIADIVLDGSGNASLPANIGDGSSTDNCSVTETSPSASFTCADLGAQTVTLTATDGSGNTDTEACSFNVVDNSAPAISCPANQTVSIDADCEATLIDYTGMTISLSDNCSDSVDIVVVQSPSASTVISADTDVTLMATDESGNSASCMFKVILDDNEPPVVTCPGDQSVDADANCEALMPDYAGLVTATDNCTGLSLVQVPVIFSIIDTSTTVTFTATDAAGNTADCSFEVTINDVTPPTITTCAPNDSLVVDGNCEAVLPDYTGLTVYSDNCDDTNDIIVTQSPASGAVISSNTTVTIYFEDLSGNIDSCSFLVELDDNIAPTITCPANISATTSTGACEVTVTWVTLASDNCDSDPVITSLPASGSVFPVGDSTITCTVTDVSGNTASCQFTVTVSDGEAPTMVCPPDTSVMVPITVTDTVINDIALITSGDNCGIDTIYYQLDGATTGSGANDASGTAFNVGKTIVTYYVVDDAGNIDSCDVEVIVFQNIILDLDCPSSITQNTDAGECSAVINTDAPTVDPLFGLDTIYYEMTGATTGSGANNLPNNQAFNVGTTTVLYTAISITSDTSVCSFTVTVTDNEAPVITCPSAMVVGNTVDSCGVIFSSAFEATATDNCPGVSVSCSFSIGDLVAVGVNTVTCTATDAAGNTSSCSYQLTVQDTQPPTIVNCPSNINVNNDPGDCGAIVTWSEPTATDNCAVLVLESSPLGSGEFFPAETTPVTYTAVDVAGNVTECTFNVKVTDNEPPTLSPCPGNITVNNDPGLCSAVVSWPFISPSDNCNVINFVVVPASNTVFDVGTTQVQAVATDAVGNVTVCSFNVTVKDNQFPTMTNVPADIVVDTDAGACGANVSWSPIQVGDNCGIDTFYCDAASGDFFVVGMHTVTCTAVDENGNIASQDFNIVVEDNELPDVDCPEDITIYIDGSVVSDPSGFIASMQAVACDSLTLNYNPISANDNCGINTIVQTGGPTTGSTLSEGFYTLTYLITDWNGNQVTCTFNLEIVGVPSAVADAFPNNPCEGEDVLFFTDDYSNATYEWKDPMGNVISTAPSFVQPALALNMTGTYEVTITFPFNCVLTAEVDVNVFANPEVVIEYNDLVCTDGSVPLVLEAVDTANAGVVDCVWELPNGTFAIGPTLTIINATSTNSGVYTVVCTTANGCVMETSRNIVIKDTPPQPDLTGDVSEACIGESIELDGEEFGGPGIDYHWTATPLAGSGIMDIDNHNNEANPSAAGTYIYQYYITQGSCISDTAEWVVVVQEDPSFSLVVDGQLDCADGTGSVEISAVTNSTNLSWSINVNGNCAAVQNDSLFTLNNVTAACSGIYEVTAKTSLGCSSTEQVNLTITNKPVTPILQATDSVICMGASTTIFSQNIPLGVGLQWTVNGANDPTFPGLPIIVSPTATTTYGLSIVNANGCVSDIGTVTVTVEAPINVGILVDGDVTCVDGTDSVRLVPNASGGVIFEWDGPCGVQFGNELQIPNITPGCSGLYSVSVTGALGQCINVGTLQLEVTGMLDPISAVLLSAACDGGDLEFCAEPAIPGATYTWTDPAGNNFGDERCPTTPAILNGKYTVTAELEGCTSTDDTVVTILTAPVAKADMFTATVDAPTSFNVVDNDILANDEYTITVTQQPANGSVSYNGQGVFTYVPRSGFRGTDIFAYEICYKDCPDLCDVALVTLPVRYPPDVCIATTVITPNNDGINDQFIISCLEVDGCPNNQLVIYNQWGDKVFEAAPYDNTWRGTYNGRDVPDGTYFYVFRCDNSSEPEKGFVMVYR